MLTMRGLARVALEAVRAYSVVGGGEVLVGWDGAPETVRSRAAEAVEAIVMGDVTRASELGRWLRPEAPEPRVEDHLFLAVVLSIVRGED